MNFQNFYRLTVISLKELNIDRSATSHFHSHQQNTSRTKYRHVGGVPKLLSLILTNILEFLLNLPSLC